MSATLEDVAKKKPEPSAEQLAAGSPDRYRPELADSLSNLGVFLSELGRAREALPAEEESVCIYRELSAESPERDRADLARSLSNLGALLSELGREARALSAAEEAVRNTGSWRRRTPPGTGLTWPTRCPTWESATRDRAVRPRRSAPRNKPS